MYSKLLVQIHKCDQTELALVNRSGTIIAPKAYETAIIKKSGEKSENIAFVIGCTAVVLCQFLSTCITKLFPKGSDPQLLPVARCGSPRLYSSHGSKNLSPTNFHGSEVLYCLYTMRWKCIFFHRCTTVTQGLTADHMLHVTFPKINT